MSEPTQSAPEERPPVSVSKQTAVPAGPDLSFLAIHPETLYNEYSDDAWARADTKTEAVALLRSDLGDDYCEWVEAELEPQWMAPRLIPRDEYCYQEVKNESGVDDEPVWYVQVEPDAPGAALYWKLEG